MAKKVIDVIRPSTEKLLGVEQGHDILDIAYGTGSFQEE